MISFISLASWSSYSNGKGCTNELILNPNAHQDDTEVPHHHAQMPQNNAHPGMLSCYTYSMGHRTHWLLEEHENSVPRWCTDGPQAAPMYLHGRRGWGLEQRNTASHQPFSHIRTQVHTEVLLQVLNLTVWLIIMFSEQLRLGHMKTSDIMKELRKFERRMGSLFSQAICWCFWHLFCFIIKFPKNIEFILWSCTLDISSYILSRIHIHIKITNADTSNIPPSPFLEALMFWFCAILIFSSWFCNFPAQNTGLRSTELLAACVSYEHTLI